VEKTLKLRSKRVGAAKITLETSGEN
jgi:hypothetical protein